MLKKLKKELMLGGMIFLLAATAGCGKQEIADYTESVQNAVESSSEDSPEKTSGTTADVEPTKEPEKLAFPVELDEKQLELGSVFGSNVINPDCEDTYGEEIATIQLKNVSGKHLKSAKVQVILSNGDTFHFLAEEMPVDMDFMVFDLENQVYDDTYRVEDILVETEYGDAVSGEEFSWEVSGSEITIENKSDKKKTDITIYYHCVIDDWGYGGTAYELHIDSLEPGEKQTVTDQNCFVGDVKISNITYK